MKLSMRASGSGTEIDLTVEVLVLTASDIPATLMIELPAGAKLTKGRASEAISVAAVGKKVYELHVSSPTPLTDQAPIRVVLDGKDPQERSGFHAERRFPERAEVPSVARSGPTPPGGRPPPPLKKTP